uniref:Uncharacterized protein n=1 Tax=Moniliophthora roreri TaxID=221103 RepID=A0A0W0EWM5_MONRR
MATVQGAHAFTMNTRDVNHVGRDMHTHYHTHSHTELPPQLDLNIHSEADLHTASTRITYQPPIIPKSTDPSLPSSLRYSLLMFQEKQGYPFWCPEPGSERSFRGEGGLMIGDVGIVHHDRPFDFLFNITYPADHYINYRGVPAGFTHLPLEDLDINRVAEYRRCSSHVVHPKYAISRDTVSDPWLPGFSSYHWHFTPTNHEGALLVLPKGSSTATLENKAVFRDYAKKHANEWFTYAEARRGRMFPTGTNPSLYVITGWEKCSSWGVSSLFIPPSISPKAIKLRFSIAGDDNFLSCRWAHESQYDESRHGSDWYETQSVFARGFKISKRRKKTKVKVRDITATTVNVEKILDLPPSTSASSSSYYSNSASGTSSNHEYGYSSGGYTRPMALAHPEDDISISDSATQEQLTFHPCNLINDFLLEAALNAGDIAISHDDDWISILDEGIMALKDMRSFFQTLCSNFDFFVHGDTIYIENSPIHREQSDSLFNIVLQKARPSRRGNPSADQMHPTSIPSRGDKDRQQEQRRDSSARPRTSGRHVYITNRYVDSSAMSAIEQRGDSSAEPKTSKLHTYKTNTYVGKSAMSAIASHENKDRQQEQRGDSSARLKTSKLHTYKTDTYVGRSAMSAIASHGNEDHQQEQRHDSSVVPRASKLRTHETDTDAGVAP